MLTPAIAGLALIVSLLALYFQRRDKKPRMRIEFGRAFIEVARKGPSGGNIYQPTPGFTIRARNQTEKDITIEHIYFVDTKGKRFQVPSNWQTIKEVPSHQSRTFSVGVAQFKKWSEAVNMFKPEKGQFILTDGVPNEHRSQRLGDSLSLEPVDKLP